MSPSRGGRALREGAVGLVTAAGAPALCLTSCTGGLSAEEKANRPSAALESAGEGIEGVEVVSTPCSAGSLTVSVRVSPDGLDSAGAEVRIGPQTRVLEVTADNAGDMKITSLRLYADDQAGPGVSFDNEAADRGLHKSLDGDFLTLVAEGGTSYARG